MVPSFVLCTYLVFKCQDDGSICDTRRRSRELVGVLSADLATMKRPTQLDAKHRHRNILEPFLSSSLCTPGPIDM